jgi:V-type H+-transporting ATPase subunit G
LRAAVEEAKGEIAEYRAEREARYARMVAEQTGNKAETDSRLKAEYDEEMAKLEAKVNAAKSAVVQDLLSAVKDVK